MDFVVDAGALVVIHLTDGEKMDAPYETLDNMKCLKENPSCN